MDYLVLRSLGSSTLQRFDHLNENNSILLSHDLWASVIIEIGSIPVKY